MNWIYLFITIWIFSGIISYGYMFGMLQKKFNHLAKESYYEDMFFSLAMSFVGGIITLIFIYLNKCYKYGYKLK